MTSQILMWNIEYLLIFPASFLLWKSCYGLQPRKTLEKPISHLLSRSCHLWRKNLTLKISHDMPILITELPPRVRSDLAPRMLSDRVAPWKENTWTNQQAKIHQFFSRTMELREHQCWNYPPPSLFSPGQREKLRRDVERTWKRVLEIQLSREVSSGSSLVNFTHWSL